MWYQLMRILLQNSLFYPYLAGGTERSTLLLARALSEAGHEVDVLTTSGSPWGERNTLSERTVAGLNGRIYQAPSVGLYEVVPPKGQHAPSSLTKTIHHALNVRSRRWLRLTRQVLILTRPDVVHTNNLVGMTTAVWQAAREYRVRTLHTIRDLHLLCPRTTMLRPDGTSCERLCWSCRIFSQLKLMASRQVDVVTSPSRHTLNRHLDCGAFRGVQTAVVPNACEEIPATLPDRTGRDTVQGLYLGSLAPHKGVLVLLEALTQLFAAPVYARLRFAFAGDGELKPQIEQFCRDHAPRCVYLGTVSGEAKDHALRASDFVVAPSVWPEAFGRVILDGYCFGLPVIGSDRGGIPEIIRDGQDGQIVTPEPEPLAKAVAWYTTDDESRWQHGLTARERVQEFTLAKQVERFLQLYRAEPTA
jgi:glycosyltransferase involved in cell wall biosynthesis